MRRSSVLLGALLLGLGGLTPVPADETRFRGPGAFTWPLEARLFSPDLETAVGHAVALNGETALVGSGAEIDGNEGQGAVYVFVQQGEDWVQQALLVASDGAAEDFFGNSVALDGDMAVVGAHLADIDGEISQGTAYVFRRAGTQWEEMQKLVASDGAELDRFGESVAIEGETIVVGATSADIGENEGQGAAYVFVDQGGAWIEVAKLFDPEGQPSDLMGNDLALQQGTLIVGASSANIGTERSHGAAYVYVGGGSAWDLEQKLLASDGADPDSFGYSVALDRDQALIGAWQKTIDENAHQGAAYVFRRGGSTWTEEQRLTASDGQAEGFFGKEVALLDNVVLVGAELDLPGNPQQGVVYEYRPQGGVWVEIQRFGAPQANGFDGFGRGIALTSDRALISQVSEIVIPPPGGSAWVLGRPVLFEDGFESGDTSAWSQIVQ